MEYCKGLTKKGGNCKRYGIYNGMCKLHNTEPLPEYKFDKRCITLTFSNVVENGPNMQMIGSIDNYHSFSVDQLVEIYDKYDGEKELIHLTLDEKDRPVNVIYEPAAVLVLRNFYQDSNNLFEELVKLSWDSKAKFII